MKKQLLFCFIGFTLLLSFESKVYAAPIANASKSVNAAPTTYTWTGAADVKWSNPANWLPSTGYPGMNVGVYDDVVIGLGTHMPTVDVTIGNIQTIDFTANTTLTLAAGLTVRTSSTIDAGVTLTTGVINFIPSLPYYFFAGDLTVKNGGGVIMLTNSYLYAVNISLLTNVYVQNAGLMRSYNANVLLGFQSHIVNSGEIIVNGSNISMSTSSYISNVAGSRFSIYSSGAGNTPVIDMGYESYIANDAEFNVSGTTIQVSEAGPANKGHIYNSGNGVFTINGGSIIDFAAKSALNGLVGNDGLFYAGTLNSPCTINLNYTQAHINNNGVFYLGSTSIINLTDFSTSVNNTGQFTLQSDQFGSAAIGNITGGSAACFGTYKVERYITGGSNVYRFYRLLSSPVSVTLPATNYSLNYAANASPTTGTNGAAGGFTQVGNPTIYLYRDDKLFSNTGFNTGNFRGVADISLAPNYTIDYDGAGFHIPVGNGFLFFYRGDKTNLANKFFPGTSAESTAMTSFGFLNQGQITVKQWFTPASFNLDDSPINGVNAGFALVGNPYPSSIDWDTYNSSSSITGIYAPGVTQFKYALNPVDKQYHVYQAGSGGVDVFGDPNANVIASGQGFFVQAFDPTAQLIFNESAKINAQATVANHNLLLSAKVPTTPKPFLNLKLLKDSINVDALVVNFNSSAKQQFDPREDALYRTGSGVVSLSSMSSDNMPLAINAQAFPKLKASIVPLNVNANTDGLYQLNMIAVKNIPALYDIWLKDAYKKDSLDIKHNPIYSFNIYKSDAASFGSTRFSLVIRQNPALGVHLLNFTALKAPGGAQVIWKTENEADYTNFTVERSTDNGVTFTALGALGSSALGTYGFLDKNPQANTADQYRIKITDLNGTVTYSKVVILQYSNLSNNIVNNNISVYPNPATSIINVSINSGTIASNGSTGLQGALSYGIKIISVTGFIVTNTTSTASNWQGNVSNLAPGTYILQVVNGSDQSLVGKTSFIKL